FRNAAQMDFREPVCMSRRMQRDDGAVVAPGACESLGERRRIRCRGEFAERASAAVTYDIKKFAELRIGFDQPSILLHERETDRRMFEKIRGRAVALVHGRS